jgi:hypothetical protein
MQHLQINTDTVTNSHQMTQDTRDSLNSRQESPGRSKYTPIVVPVEEAPLLIVVESRDISPEARKSESYTEVPSPRSESYDHFNDSRNSSCEQIYTNKTNTPSPPPRSDVILKDNENIGSVPDYDRSKKKSSNVTKSESKDSTVQSDAITTPCTNRKGARASQCGNRPATTSNQSTGVNISPTPDRVEEDLIPNVTSMISSLTSMDSKWDQLNEKQYLPGTVPPQHAFTKLNVHRSPKQQRARNSLSNKGSMGEKEESPKVMHTTKGSHTSQRHRNDDVSTDNASTSTSTLIHTIATTPDTVYDVLNDEETSCSQLDSGIATLPYNLTGVLRGTSTDAASIFHDFQNPCSPSSPKPFPLRLSTLVEAPTHDVNYEDVEVSAVKSEQSCIPSISVQEMSQFKRRERTHTCSVFENDVISSYSPSIDIANHSILELCTEDLMSDNEVRVCAALARLYDVCCFVGEQKVNEKMKSSSSVMSTSSTSSSVLNRIRFIKAGGHALIVGVMKKFQENADIQAAACKLIRQFILMDECNIQSSNVSTKDQVSSNRHANAGAFNELFSAVYGMDCVIAVLQRFPSTKFPNGKRNNDVYNLACGALVAIVCSSFKMVDRLLQHDIRYITVFLTAMHAPINKNTPGVNRVIYHVLKQFPQYVNEIVVANGIEEVINEMKRFSDSVEVQYCGCAIVGILLKKNSRMMMSTLSAQHAKKYSDQSLVNYIVNQLDGAAVIVTALKAFPFNEDVQGKGVTALCNITLSVAGMKAGVTIISSIKKAGGLSAIGIALENFPNNQTVQNHGCLAIKSILECAIVTSTVK